MEKLMEKSMTCEECQLAIIENVVAEHDPVVKAHLKECADCRGFAEFYGKVLTWEDDAEDVKLPEFAELKKRADWQKNVSKRFLRMFVVQISAAAAFLLVIGGVFFQMYSVKAPVSQPERAGKTVAITQATNVAVVKVPSRKDEELDLSGDLSRVFADSEAFTAALEENTVTLAWDTTSRREAQCRDSLNAVAQSKNWTIEYFNPYSEE